MSYASMFLMVALFINIFIFLAGQPMANSPMIGFMMSIYSGSPNWGMLLNTNLLWLGAICAAVGIVSIWISPMSALTGNFSTVHVMTIMAMALFITLFAIPNFSVFGFPYPIGELINTIFGAMIMLSIMGFLRGE